MALTGTVTLHGGSAGAVFHDHGAINLSPFSNFSSFLSDQYSFGPSSSIEIDSGSLTLQSKFGNLLFSNADTISASYGGDTVTGGSVGISFVFGSSTTSLFSTPYSDTLPGGASSALSKALAAATSNVSLGGASSELKLLDPELLKPATPAPTVPAAAAVTPIAAAPTGSTEIKLGDTHATIVKLTDHNKG